MFMAFRLKKLFIDVGNGRLIINDREVPLGSICEFSLTLESGTWMLSGKRDLLLPVQC